MSPALTGTSSTTGLPRKSLFYFYFLIQSIANPVQFSSVTHSCPTLCDPMDCSSGFPVHHQLPELASDSCLLSWWCHPTISSSVIPFSSRLQSFPASGSFPVSRLFTSGSPSIGVSVSPSIFPMNIQGCFPLGLTGLISLQCKGLSRIFSSTIIRKHEFLMLSLFYGPALTSVHDYWKSHSFDCSFVGKMMSLLFNTASRSS